MTTAEIYNNCKSFVAFIAIFNKNVMIGSGTGFLLESGHFVTNFHVLEKSLLDMYNGAPYIIKFIFENNVVQIQREDIAVARTQCCSEEHNNDYIILDLRSYLSPEFYESSFLQFDNMEPYIGQKCCLLGYPFGQKRLAIHECVISSIYSRCGVNVYQLDGSVNNGNSGGPLVNVETGKIIGIVSRKENGLDRMFNDLKHAVINNRDIILAQQATLQLGGLDVIKALTVSFTDMEKIIEQLERSANVGIGYAFDINRIKEDITILTETM